MIKFSDKIENVREGYSLFEYQRHFLLPEKLENPWPGLAAYRDPLISDYKHLFCGRDKESFEMTRMIDDNIFVTLYGKSGNGKTSLLNAGVFPLLRKMQYVPFSIRLGMEPNSRTFQESIIRTIEKHFESERIEQFWIVPPMQNRSADEYLWNYFARHRFFADEQKTKPVRPVIVFDQFEEVYKKRSQDADVLLRQIHYMMDEIHKLESCITEKGELYEYEYNFRFVVSIREDDLFLLEDSIDNNYLQQMKQTRYRLLPISPQGARDVILKPADEKKLYANVEKEKIVETIINISKGDDKNSPISSNVLSLICNRIYVSYYQVLGGKGQITYKLVEQFVSEKPLEKFYLEATKDLSRNERTYLEDNFVDVDGRRGAVSQANFRTVFKKKAENLLKEPFKILQENNGKVELIHDSFCQVLLSQKNKRQERWRNIVEHIALMIMCVVIYYLSIAVQSYVWAVEPKSALQSFIHSIMGCIPIYSPIFLFVIVGTMRRSFPILFTRLSALLISIPMFYDFFISTDPTIHLSISYYLISLGLLAFLMADYMMVKRQRKHSKPTEDMKFWGLFDLWSLRLWLLVYMCLLLYSIMYKSLDGNYMDNTYGFTAMNFMIPLFFSLFNRDNWVWIWITIAPVSIMVYLTSDVNFMETNDLSNWTGLVFLMISAWYGYLLISACISTTDSIIKGTICGVIILLLLFGYYYVFYQNKFLMLSVWCLFFYFLVFFIEKNKTIITILTYVSTFFFTIVLFVFMKGYNPTIIGVNANKQTGTWRWKNVIAFNGDEYHLRDAITGQDLLGAGFKKQGKNYELKIPVNQKANIRYSIKNPLIEIPGDSNELTYKVKPLFEERISRSVARKRFVSSVFYKNRQRILNMFAGINQLTISDKDLREVQNILISKEQQKISAIIETNNDSIIKNDLPRQLCKGLSCSWLYNSIDGSTTEVDSDNAFYYLAAFVNFVDSHYYEDIFEYQNKDWDGTFESIALGYLENLEGKFNIAPKDQYLQYVVPCLISYYLKTEDHGLKTQLYGKIIRLQQLAICYGLGKEDWTHVSLPSPISIDIKNYYNKFRQKIENNHI